MYEVLVLNKLNDLKIGKYTTCIKPAVGEYLDANNGHWVILAIQHQIRGALDITAPASFQTELVVYVTQLIEK